MFWVIEALDINISRQWFFWLLLENDRSKKDILNVHFKKTSEVIAPSFPRACRLKKKAQYEANKVKLWGLNTEYGNPTRRWILLISIYLAICSLFIIFGFVICFPCILPSFQPASWI